MQTQQGNDATRLGLERYVLELEMYGLTTVPPEATGVSVATLDCATEVLSVTMKDQPWDDCDNPEVMAELLGFNDGFPYLNEPQPAPRFIESEATWHE